MNSINMPSMMGHQRMQSDDLRPMLVPSHSLPKGRLLSEVEPEEEQKTVRRNSNGNLYDDSD